MYLQNVTLILRTQVSGKISLCEKEYRKVYCKFQPGQNRGYRDLFFIYSQKVAFPVHRRSTPIEIMDYRDPVADGLNLLLYSL